MKSHAVYVGSFDPISLGHCDIIRRGADLFQNLTVGIGINPEKQALFSPSERLEICRTALAQFPNVEVTTFEGLAVEFVRQCECRILLRGIRSLTDLDVEFTMSLANRVLAEDIESVFLMSSERYNHISSSLIKQIARMGSGNLSEQLRLFVPPAVIEPLLDKMCSSK